jgi:hypothetical protein
MPIEEPNYLSLKEIRIEFNKIVNEYISSKKLNTSDLSVNPINKLRLSNKSKEYPELEMEPSTRI